jgi:hypothetical protein
MHYSISDKNNKCNNNKYAIILLFIGYETKKCIYSPENYPSAPQQWFCIPMR